MHLQKAFLCLPTLWEHDQEDGVTLSVTVHHNLFLIKTFLLILESEAVNSQGNHFLGMCLFCLSGWAVSMKSLFLWEPEVRRLNPEKKLVLPTAHPSTWLPWLFCALSQLRVHSYPLPQGPLVLECSGRGEVDEVGKSWIKVPMLTGGESFQWAWMWPRSLKLFIL